MDELHFQVPAICCRHCSDAIAAAVGALPGVDHIETDATTGWVTVTGPALDITTIRAAVDHTGHQAAL